MNIVTKWRIGQMVKVYFTRTKEGKITRDIGYRYGIIEEIKISLDIVTNEPIILYRLHGYDEFYSERSLMRANI